MRLVLIVIVSIIISTCVVGQSSVDCTPQQGNMLRKMLQESEEVIARDLEHHEQEFLQLLSKNEQNYMASNTSMQVHLSLTNESDQLLVTWISKTTKYTKPIVQWGTSATNLNYQSPGNTSTYHTDYNLSKPIVGFRGWIYDALLTPLSPNTLYYYRVGDVNTGVYSDIFTFTLRGQQSNQAFSFAAFGDMGTFPGGGVDGRRTTHRMTEILSELDFAVHAGDIAYAYGFNDIWDLFGEQIEPVAAYIPYMTVVGNHEQESPFNFTAYAHRYPMSYNPGSPPFWYSFQYGSMYFIAMSTEQDWSLGSTQYQWIVNQLIQANQMRAQFPWLFVYFHKPMYCSNAYSSCSGYAASIRAVYETLFNQYQVNLVYFGHVHAYERSYPVNNCAVSGTYENPTAPVYVLAGCAGALWNDDQKDWTDPQPEWSAYREAKWGFTKVQVFNQTTLQISYYENESGSIADSFYLNNWYAK